MKFQFDSCSLAAMAVSVVDVRRGFVSGSLPEGVLRFPSAGSSLLYVEDAVAVDAADVRANAQAGMAEAVFFSFTNLHQVLDNNLEDDDGRHRLNSRVISASIGRAGRHVELARPARIALSHLEAADEAKLTDPICVFWDLESR